MRSFRAFMRGIAVFLFLIFLPALPAHAACSNPSGNAGDKIYNADQKFFQFCDGAEWRRMHAAAGSGTGGCTNPLMNEGDVFFNADYRVMQGCAGNVWRPFGPVRTDVTSGLVGWWKLNESSGDAADSSGNSNTGTINGNPIWQPTGGKVGGALSFDDNGDYAAIANEPNFDFERTQPFTVTAWVYRNGAATGDMIFSKSNSTSDNRGYEIVMPDSTCGGTGCLLVLLANDSSNLKEIYLLSNSVSAVALGTWQHIAVTYDGSSVAAGIKVYVNASPITTGIVRDNLTATMLNDQSPRIGAASDAGASFNGRLDDVRVYDRELSAEEIAQIYAAAPPDGPVGWWKLDESSGAAIADSAGSNDGAWTDNDNDDVTEEAVSGQIGGALSFDGNDDYVDIANESNFDFDRTDPFSISAWINYTADNAGYTIVSKTQNGGNFPGFQFRADATNERLLADLDGTGGDGIGVGTDFGSLSPGAWHHVVMTYDGSSAGTGLLSYIDGTPEETGTGTLSSSILNDTMVRIGHNPAAASAFNGKIDDVRIYNRVLSAEEIEGLYANGEVPQCYNPPGNAGDMIRNADYNNALQYCDGLEWVAAGGLSCDDAPDAFSFTDLTGQNPVTQVNSDMAVEITGIVCPATVSVSGSGSPEWRSCDDSGCSTVLQDWTSSSSAIASGQYIQVRHTSSSSPLTAQDTVVSVGGGSDTWSSTTSGWNYAFVTSTTQAGNALGGVAGADGICAARATAGGLPGTYKAWISTADAGDDAPIDRFTKPTLIPYREPDATRTMVAGNWADLVDGGIASAINTDETGTARTGNVWTNVTTAGAFKHATNHCADWAGGTNGQRGSSTATNGNWTDGGTTGCGTALRLYCVQQDGTAGGGGEPTAGLVAHWKLDETAGDAADATGNGNTGTLNGDAAWQSAGGIDGGAVSLDNAGDYIVVADSATVRPAAAFTLAAWVNPTSLADNDMIISKPQGNGSSLDDYSVALKGSGQIEFCIEPAAEMDCMTTTNSAVSTGAWTFIVAVWDGATMRVYRNGIIDSASGNHTNAPVYGTSSVYIGAENEGGSMQSFFHGKIDDARIYDRALGAGEIVDLYLATGGTP